jgi:hypothetical protein
VSNKRRSNHQRRVKKMHSRGGGERDCMCAVCARSDLPKNERYNAYLRDDLLPTISKSGYAIQGVFAVEDGHSSFCYTVGLSMREWPELIILGIIDLGEVALRRVVAHFINAGTEPAPGDYQIFNEKHLVRLRACDPFTEEWPLNVAGSFAGRENLRALQVLIPDDHGRYPGEDGASGLSWQKLIPAL